MTRSGSPLSKMILSFAIDSYEIPSYRERSSEETRRKRGLPFRRIFAIIIANALWGEVYGNTDQTAEADGRFPGRLHPRPWIRPDACGDRRIFRPVIAGNRAQASQEPRAEGCD